MRRQPAPEQAAAGDRTVVGRRILCAEDTRHDA
jgi:hypothetical protein